MSTQYGLCPANSKCISSSQPAMHAPPTPKMQASNWPSKHYWTMGLDDSKEYSIKHNKLSYSQRQNIATLLIYSHQRKLRHLECLKHHSFSPLLGEKNWSMICCSKLQLQLHMQFGNVAEIIKTAILSTLQSTKTIWRKISIGYISFLFPTLPLTKA